MTALAVIIFITLAAGSAMAIVAISRVLGGKPLAAAKDVPYECGMPPEEKPNTLFSVRFYKVALLFVVFDIEIVFLYLWALVVRELGFFGLVEIFVFVAILLAAFFFAWRKGDLDWE
ncbi:MAG: NADH-quinone oxidoreductase subunit A [Syntrophus sp. (in: bacteria)]|nr:NADH-quinone oxidoreductase subunit A [Syntrophus sp. (in: bacteria)]